MSPFHSLQQSLIGGFLALALWGCEGAGQTGPPDAPNPAPAVPVEPPAAGGVHPPADAAPKALPPREKGA
jgi:hypothetical protein